VAKQKRTLTGTFLLESVCVLATKLSMKYLISLSSTVIVALCFFSLPFVSSAATLFQLNSGTVIQMIGAPSPESTQGATSTALFNALAGSTLYIAYCLNLTNQTGSAPVNMKGLASSTASAPQYWSETAYSIAGNAGTQEICHTSTTTLVTSVDVGRDYFMAWDINGVHTGATWDMNSPGSYLYIADTPIAPVNSATHIISAIPSDGEVVATSTAGLTGALINVNANQWSEALAQNAGNWFVNVQVISPANTQCGWRCFGAFGTVQNTYKFPITTSGILSLATTTDTTAIGVYKMSIQIVEPSWASTYLSWFGFSGTVLDSTTTTFTVSHETGFDALNASSTSVIDQFLASTSPQLIASCSSWQSFDLADCLNLLFIPQPSTFSYIMADVNGVLQFAPWGYATRVVSIMSGSATSSFPMIVAGIPDPTDPTQKMLWHIDPNEMIAGAATLNDSIVDPVTGDPVMPGVRQIVDSVIALSVMSYIFYDLIGGKRSTVSHKTKLS